MRIFEVASLVRGLSKRRRPRSIGRENIATAQSKSLTKALDLLEACVAQGGGARLATVARHLDIPVPTAYRLARTLQDRGLLACSGRGRYFPGPRLYTLSQQLTARTTAAGLSRPLLAKLARRFRCIAHFGVYEEEMVTYLVRAGEGRSAIATEEGTQLEAYCSAIGKILLAELGEDAREAYLATGPFTPLTDRTIVAPDALRAELWRTAARGYAVDDREIYDNLLCLAVPVRTRDFGVVGAISLSMPDQPLSDAMFAARLAALREAAAMLAEQFSGDADDG